MYARCAGILHPLFCIVVEVGTIVCRRPSHVHFPPPPSNKSHLCNSNTRDGGETVQTPTMVLKACPVASLALLLFLVVNGVSAYSSSGWCISEETACLMDEVCVDCLGAMDDDSSVWFECVTNHGGNVDGGCPAVSAEPCCNDFVSPHDCLGNVLYATFALCNMSRFVGEGCTTFTCDFPTGSPTPSPTSVGAPGGKYVYYFDDDWAESDDQILISTPAPTTPAPTTPAPTPQLAEASGGKDVYYYDDDWAESDDQISGGKAVYYDGDSTNDERVVDRDNSGTDSFEKPSLAFLFSMAAAAMRFAASVM